MEPKNDQRAIAMANEFAGLATLDRVFWQIIFEEAGREPLFDFCEQFDPEFRKKELLESTLQDDIRKILPKDKKDLIAEFASMKSDVLNTWQSVSFYIGVAWGKQMAAIGAGSPATVLPPAAAAATPEPEERETTNTETRAGQKRPSLEDVLTNLLEDAAMAMAFDLKPGCTVSLSSTPADYLKLPECQELEDRLKKMLMKGREPEMEDEDDVMGVLWDWASFQEHSSVATAYTAGLRAGGMSEEMTRQRLRGFLRQFEDPQQINSED